jgi:hypothetical protein
MNKYTYNNTYNFTCVKFPDCFGVLCRLCRVKGSHPFSHFECLRAQQIWVDLLEMVPKYRELPGKKFVSLHCVWNVMAHAQIPDFVFRQNGRVPLNRPGWGEGGCQFSRLLAGELCTSACRVCTARASLYSAVMWRLLVTHSIRQFPLHFPCSASPCAITFQTQSTTRQQSLFRHVVFMLTQGAF